MSIVLGIDPSIPPGRQVAVRRNVRGWRAISGGDTPLREKPTQVVLSVPSELLTFRTLSVPFTDKRRAEDVARQELANSLPMPLSEVRWSLCPLDKHQYLAIVSPRNRLDLLTANCKPRPDIVDAEPFSYARALACQDIRDGLVVDFEDERTIFCVVRNARPAFVRVLLRGARSAWPLKGPDLKAWFAHLIADAMLPNLDADLGVYMTGSGASADEFSTALTETLHRTVRPFPVPEGLSSTTDVGALGAALRSVDDGVDLMRHRQTGRPQWMLYAVAVAVLVGLWTVDLAVRQYEAAHRAAVYRTAVAHALSQAPGIKDVKTLQDKINEAPKRATDSVTLLDILKTLADKSTGKAVRLQEVQYGEGHVELTGFASSFKDQAALQKDLSAVYKDLQLQDAHQSQDGKVHFKYRLGVKL